MIGTAAEYGRSRGINWTRFVTTRECETHGCLELIVRITFRPRGDKENPLKHAPPEPLYRRCYICAAEIHHRTVVAKWEHDSHFLPRPEYSHLVTSVRRMLGVRGFAESFPVYDGPSDRKWRLDGAPRGPHPCAI